MFKFLVKGLMRDPSRSRFPVIIVAFGIFLVVFMYGFLMGVINDMINTTAKMESGHFNVMTRAYEDMSNIAPNDLALMNADSTIRALEGMYPDIVWTPRINFGGLIDVPDERGETRVQAPVSYVIGFIPGITATFLGTLAASYGIKKRETAQLFKELEV